MFSSYSSSLEYTPNRVIRSVSSKRISEFLNLSEMDSTNVYQNSPPQTTITYTDLAGRICETTLTEDAIQVEHGWFAWSRAININDKGDKADTSAQATACLQDISLSIPKGALVGIIGRVGSGKSSLFAAILGEMNKQAGVVATRGRIALAEQQPWLMNCTIRENILFNMAMEEERYASVLRACCLEDDLREFDGGDLYHVGNDGLKVSGGQRARISLARCCYSQADIVLMDDPLAAVDTRIAKQLFERCIQKEMAGRTRLLILSSTQFLSQCDLVFQVEDSTIRQVSAVMAASVLEKEQVREKEEKSSGEYDGQNGKDKGTSTKSGKEVEKVSRTEDGQEEKKAEGIVPWSTYQYYLGHFGRPLLVFILLCFLAYMIFTITSTFLLSDWSADPVCNSSVHYPQEMSTECLTSTQAHMKAYIILFFGKLISLCARSFFVIPGRFRASSIIHSRLTKSLLYAPMEFHDNTPIGRTLNRFSKDMNVIDTSLPASLMLFFAYGFELGGDVITITASTNVFMLVVLLFSFFLYARIQKAFRGPNTDIRRLEAIAKSPVLSRYRSALRGFMSIHAFGTLPHYLQEIEEKIVRSNHVTHLTQHMSTYLTWRSDLLAAGINSATAIVTLLLSSSSSLSASRLGIALTSSSGINGILKYLIQQLVSIEANMNAVDRVREYAEELPQDYSMRDMKKVMKKAMNRPKRDGVEIEMSNIPKEKLSSTPSTRIMTGEVAEENDDNDNTEIWLTQGQLEFDHLQLRYGEGPLVLKETTFSIRPKEKIGVVGRTGAGKSSLTTALFRLRELCGGSILIDGRNIAKIPLHTLRTALAIVPQDPTLFATTLRFNLDPMRQYTDEQLWSVIDRVGLRDCETIQTAGLETAVEEGGQNFSVGERQLLCVARVILQSPKIVVMDEATASLDEQTQETLQKMIDTEFRECTVISIAHRLNTILQCDRVCVMSDGEVVEYNSPQLLQQQENSLFRKMLQSG